MLKKLINNIKFRNGKIDEILLLECVKKHADLDKARVFHNFLYNFSALNTKNKHLEVYDFASYVDYKGFIKEYKADWIKKYLGD